ncbi:hypothetical protein SO802_011319 [Lithocarpus litseifolius]|uniref:Protein kinase domain-containing protein n=1 Tax=Lithocarpus litseifolius TaxID=425828 RepID=A0AAW2D252_9ROSI
MASEVFKHWRYDKKVDVFSFAMILYEMLEGDPPLANLEPYEAAKYVRETGLHFAQKDMSLN